MDGAGAIRNFIDNPGLEQPAVAENLLVLWLSALAAAVQSFGWRPDRHSEKHSLRKTGDCDMAAGRVSRRQDWLSTARD